MTCCGWTSSWTEATKKKQALRIDEVATVVRRAVEALKQFHDCKAGNAYGLLTPKHVYYDRRGQKLLLPAVGVSNFLWAAMGWERLATWQDEAPNLASYVAPEVADGQPATAKTDQYMLGQLAFEMLEGRLPFVIRRTSEVQAEGRVLGRSGDDRVRRLEERSPRVREDHLSHAQKGSGATLGHVR